jgi:hypothetical protein
MTTKRTDEERLKGERYQREGDGDGLLDVVGRKVREVIGSHLRALIAIVEVRRTEVPEQRV